MLKKRSRVYTKIVKILQTHRITFEELRIRLESCFVCIFRRNINLYKPDLRYYQLELINCFSVKKTGLLEQVVSLTVKTLGSVEETEVDTGYHW